MELLKCQVIFASRISECMTMAEWVYWVMVNMDARVQIDWR